MNFKGSSFLTYLLAGILVMASSMLVFNYYIDPGQKLLSFNSDQLSTFIKVLESSKYGTRLPRVLSMPKLAMLKASQNKESVIIGNSQTYILGFNKSLTPKDFNHNTLLNLSLSHLGYNEMLYLLAQAYKKKINQVLIIIPHHLFLKTRYDRWPQKIIEEMTVLENEDKTIQRFKSIPGPYNTLNYLSSFNTTWQSFDHIKRWKLLSFEKNYHRPLNKKPNLNDDYKSFVLKNGATAWSSDNYRNLINNRSEETKKMLNHLEEEIKEYQLDNPLIRKQAIESLKKTFSKYQKLGIKFYFMIGPIFTEYLKKEGKTDVYNLLHEIQHDIVALARSLNVSAFGGINQCQNQMYDLLHPYPECLVRSLKNNLSP